MKPDVRRLLAARSIAVIGGGAWCAAIIEAAQRIGYDGQIWPVHPTRPELAGLVTVARVGDLPEAPDVAFVGVNRQATLQVVADLRARGAGGAVCFASGFTEAAAEDAAGADLQAALVAAADGMPIFGPNCYGFVNALDRVAVWPDQHGLVPVPSGVAILTQSSNIALNLTMQRRGLPVAQVITCGNMAQISQAALAQALLEDERITAIGLHVEGFGDLRAWEDLAHAAWARGVPLVALKVGRSDQARAAAVSHTASLAGSDAGARAFLRRLGIPEVADLESLLEALKLMHVMGRLASNRIASISCSGGEASLLADLAQGRDLVLPPLPEDRHVALRAALGPKVALANPLDYHTYIWRDVQAMARAWGAMTGPDLALTLSVVDYPLTDRRDWDCATQAAQQVRHDTGHGFAVVSSLPELMPEDVAQELIAAGVVPMCGLAAALSAIEAVAQARAPEGDPVALPGSSGPATLLGEGAAKAALAAHGVNVPRSGEVQTPAQAGALAADLTAPVVLKGTGHAHKTEAGAVRLNLQPDQVTAAAQQMGGDGFLVEEMITGTVAELLIGVLRDPAHGFVLTIGAGGVLTEILRDTVSLLLPARADQIRDALTALRCWPLLQGYRGQAGADIGAIVAAVLAVQDYVLAQRGICDEVEINPLICTATRAIAVDALIRQTAPPNPKTDDVAEEAQA